MLTYRNTFAAFIIIMLTLAAVNYWHHIGLWIFIGIILAQIILMILGSIYIRANYYMKSISNGDPGKQEIALTFDDGPDAEVTPAILDVLKKHGVKAAFFIVGQKAESNPGIVKRIELEGHILGGHSYSHHYFFDLFSSKRMKRELQETENMVRAITGKRMKFFRPPYGVTNPPLARAVRNLKYQSVGWSLKSKDTIIREPAELLKNITGRIKAGDIVLFHDNRPWTVDTLDDFLTYLDKTGIRVSGLDKLLNIEPYVN